MLLHNDVQVDLRPEVSWYEGVIPILPWIPVVFQNCLPIKWIIGIRNRRKNWNPLNTVITYVLFLNKVTFLCKLFTMFFYTKLLTIKPSLRQKFTLIYHLFDNFIIYNFLRLCPSTCTTPRILCKRTLKLLNIQQTHQTNTSKKHFRDKLYLVFRIKPHKVPTQHFYMITCRRK